MNVTSGGGSIRQGFGFHFDASRTYPGGKIEKREHQGSERRRANSGRPKARRVLRIPEPDNHASLIGSILMSNVKAQKRGAFQGRPFEICGPSDA